jgi:hypothetical protein
VLCLFNLTGYEPGKLLKYRISRYSTLLSKPILNMSIAASFSRSNGSIKPLRGKENFSTWQIEIETILLRNNNAAYIRNGPRAARPSTRYLDEYHRELKQYDRDLEAYNAAAATQETATQETAALEAAGQEAGGRPGRAPARPILPKKPDEAKGEEKELKIWEEKRANALTDVIENIHYTLRRSIQNHQSTVEALLEYCTTLYGSIGQNEKMRAYSNLNSIRLSSCGSLQQYVIRFNNAFEESIRIGATLSYGLILFWFIEFLDNDEYRFWKESFKAKIRELSDENLEEGNWIRQAQQELLDRNIDPTGTGDGKSSMKRSRDESIGEVNLTTKDTTRSNSKSNRNKRSKSANSDSSGVSAKSQESTRNKQSASNTPKCKVCDGNHTTEDCYYTSKNPPSRWSGKPEIWRKIIETRAKQD